jgi:hAT family C-terminal dimerisation region
MLQVPERAKGYLFEYELVKLTSRVNAVMRYTNRIYMPGSDVFECFEETEETQLMPLPTSNLEDAHELWQQALGRTNAKIYTDNQALEKGRNAIVVDGSTSGPLHIDVSDIDSFFQLEGRGPHLLEFEFTPDTEEPVEYLLTNGKPSRYWCWTHRSTGVSVKRFASVSGKSFDTGRLSKYLLSIKESQYPIAYARAKHVLLLNESIREQSDDCLILPAMDRRTLLGQQVKLVLFAIEANVAAVALQGTMAKQYFRHLVPAHRPPQNLPFMRLVRLLDLAFFREYRRLIDDNVLWLGNRFASTNSDFYQCPERRESYGCIVSNMCAWKYFFKDGRQLFVSQKTLNEGVRSKLSISDGSLSGLETVLAFKKFDGVKSGVGIGTWLRDEHASKGLLPDYVCYHSTDGASNAVASANFYTLLTEINRNSAINHDKCMAHQNNRSAKYASGAGDFKECANVPLRDVLTKTHNIISRVHRSSHRMNVVREVQRNANRRSIVLPVPSVVTRWDSSNLEVASINRIMGDFNKSLHLLLDGHDKHLLINKDQDGDPLPRMDFTFTATDRTILRQFECGSHPCLMLSKFYQLNEATVHETLFVTVARIAQMRETSFLMFGDISHTELPDLRQRNRTVVVVSTLHLASIYEDDGREEQAMDPCIEEYRRLYANDMEHRCGLSSSDGNPAVTYPTIIGMSCLLNPMYGGQLNMERAGLMNKTQYEHAEEDLLTRMQLMRERESGIVVMVDTSSDDYDSECMDDPVVRCLSTEREKAKEEFRVFCNVCKMQRNRPRSYVGNTLQLGPKDMRAPIVMGKVGVRGEDIRASQPFVTCNLADFINDDGRFNLAAFFHLQRECFPTLYKLSVCLASIRTNEVGCERFFSMAGYVSCPRRTRLNVRNYECLSALRSNMQRVYIDESWVVDMYLKMEKEKTWNELQADDDMRVLHLEQQLLAETLGCNVSALPPIRDDSPLLEG